MNLDSVLPVVLTCARRLDYVSQFVQAYVVNVGNKLPAPLVIVDTTISARLPGRYLSLLNQLAPRQISIHTRVGETDYDSVQDAARFTLQEGVGAAGAHKYLLFVEDDIIFSTKFIEALSNVQHETPFGYHTFYTPWGGFPVETLTREMVFGGHLFGTQCILFPVSSARLILDNIAEVKKYPPGYDLQWSRFLYDRGLPIRTSIKSYVQHIGGESRLGCMGHVSHCFVE